MVAGAARLVAGIFVALALGNARALRLRGTKLRGPVGLRLGWFFGERNRRVSNAALTRAALAFSAGFCTTDPVGMCSTVGLVVLTQQRESGTGVTEFAVALGGTFLGEDADTFH
jgi:hypothetical protein